MGHSAATGVGRGDTWRLCLALLALLTGPGCDRPLEPDDRTVIDGGAARWTVKTIVAPMLSSGPSCPAVSNCSMRIVGGSESCVCELDGLDVSAAGGTNPPPNPPPLPPPPGWTWPDPTTFGGGGYPPPAPGTPCDPNAISGGCNWTATLECQTGITRGGSASCFFSINPSSALDYISGWTFAGTHVVNTSGYYGTSWSGTVVESGEVTVHFQAKGSPAKLVSYIGVDPRSGWNWTSADRSFSSGSPGQLDGCIGGQAGLTADYLGCTSSNPGVLINPGPNAGFTVGQGTGPNQGLWYVTSRTTRMDLRTQLARKYRSDEPAVPIVGDAQALQACGSAYSPGAPPPQNNHSVNTVCFQNADFNSLVAFTWNHEGQHLGLAQQEAGQSYNDIYADWELIVRPSQSEAQLAANAVQNAMHAAVANQANSIHTGGTTSFAIWYQTSSGVWQPATVITTH